jgi:hypothetical protein
MSILTNFQLSEQGFMDKFEAAKFNLSRELEGADAIYLIDRVISKINDDLLTSTRKQTTQAKAKPITKSDKANDSPQDILELIEQWRQKKLDLQIKKAKPEERQALMMSN